MVGARMEVWPVANVTLGQGQLGFTDKRRVAGQQGVNVATPANFIGIANMRARLIAINAAYYTTARLDAMTENDMVFAIRSADEAAGF